jgi:ring-1,2-phenylacetyl-CoA epoxidase subunit PaaD
MPTVSLNEEAVWQALDEVKDPELPLVSVVEMGIVREVELDEDRVTVRFTPTFSGCPALEVMRQEIERKLRELGCETITVETVLSPPWSSDWISETGREKLKALGIAPPSPQGAGNVVFFEPVPCPRCDSPDTRVTNTFGPTLCKAIYVCNACREPFEAFKRI